MFKKGMRVLFAAAAALPLIASTAWAEGLMTIIVNDPSNPYWYTEGEIAKKTAEGLGYKAVVGGHKGDTNTESNLIDTAITNKSVAIILDPANADGSIGAVKRAIAANIPVFLVNAESIRKAWPRHSSSPTMHRVPLLAQPSGSKALATRASMSSCSVRHRTITLQRARTAMKPFCRSIQIL